MPHSSYSDSDSDAPESYSLNASKASEKRKNEEIEQVHAALKRQTKRKNQERDRVLKEQAQRRKERENAGNGVGGSNAAAAAFGSAIEARMNRAMEEAQEEEEEEEVSDISEWGGIGDGYYGTEPSSKMDDDDVQNEFHERTRSSEDGLDDGSTVVPQKSIKRLPDHLFVAAFASQKAQASAPQNPTMPSEPAKGEFRMRRKATRPRRDVIIGSRTIRTLSSTLQISKQGAYAPTRKAQKYVNRSLALKGGNSRVRGWERRAANIGVMRHSGPAANFVRS